MVHAPNYQFSDVPLATAVVIYTFHTSSGIRDQKLKFLSVQTHSHVSKRGTTTRYVEQISRRGIAI